jgi:hypothetical protein
MATADAVNIRLVRARLQAIRGVLREGDFSKLRFGPVAFLQKEIEGDGGALRNITVELRDIGQGRVMDFGEGPKGRVLQLAQSFMDAASKLASDRKLSHRQTIWMVDNFLLHELLHESQGMGGGRHSDLRVQSPQTLLAIDYQADAAAVVVAVILAWQAPTSFGFGKASFEDDHWSLYAEAIAAVTHQIEIFTYLSRSDLDRAKIAEMPVTVERIQRIAAWHFQYHRAKNFDRGLSLADFQILLQPGIDFRNLRTAGLLQPDLLTANWPKNEENFVKWVATQEKSPSVVPVREPLIMTCSSPMGTTRFHRFTPASPSHYEDAFVGFFTAEMEKSRRFFESWLRDCEWATGRGGAVSVRKIVRTRETRGLAMDRNGKDRSEILLDMLTPRNFPQVFAARM